MTGIRELDGVSAISPAPEQVRISLVGGHTQLDVALPVGIPVASLVPELARLVRSRDAEASTDTPWAATRDTFWVLTRLDPLGPLQPSETLRAAGVIDGELLQLTDQRAPAAPTLYDDVVDAAAQLNKAAYAGWDATAARWMSFVGIALASLVWVYFVVNVTAGAQRTLVVGVAVVVTATMVGVATLAHRSHGRADIGAAVGWAALPIGAAIGWATLRGFGDYGVAAGCALVIVLSAACYFAIGTGRWGYLASGVLLATNGLAVLSRALGVSAPTVGAVLAVSGALGCLTVSRLTIRLARVEPSARRPNPNREAMLFDTPFTSPQSAPDSGIKTASYPGMPTAEAVWARVRAASVTGSALYAGLAVSVFCGVVAVLRAGPDVGWAALGLAAVCATALGVYARVPGSALERGALGVPAVALVVAGCVRAWSGTAAMAWTGFSMLLVVAIAASAVGLRMAVGRGPHRWARGWAYAQYAAYAALIPVALWAADVDAKLGIR